MRCGSCRDNLSVEEVVAEAQQLFQHWPNLNPEETRAIVEAMTKKVVVKKDEVIMDHLQ